SDTMDPVHCQLLFRFSADARNLSDIERRKKCRLGARGNPEHSVRLRLSGRDFGEQARGGDPDRAVESGVALDAVMEVAGGLHWAPKQPFRAGAVEERLIAR